jgi:drug/metabolite transporter (DMT)-like permease
MLRNSVAARLARSLGTRSVTLAETLLPGEGRLGARWQALPPNMRGILWIMAAGMVLTVMAAIIKSLGARIPVVEILFIRQVVMSLMLGPRIARDPRGAFATPNFRLHALRVGLSVLAMTTGFTAIVHLPMADAVAVSFSKSFFVTIFAMLILHEVVTRQRWTAVVLGFLGVVVMVRPSADGIDFYALLGLVSAASVGLIMVIIRKLAQREPLGTVLTYQAVGVGLVLMPPALWLWVTPEPWEWALLVVIGVLSAIGQSMNFNAFRVGEATALASADYLRLVFATALGVAVFGEWPTVNALIGAALIIATTGFAMESERRHAARARRGEADAAGQPAE